jgi:hypothetical protein
MPASSLHDTIHAAHRDFADRVDALEGREQPHPGDIRRYRVTAKSLSRDLVRHVEAVEQVLLPAARDAGGRAAAAAEAERPRLRHIESLLRDLDARHDVASLDETVTALVGAFREHAEATENGLIPALEDEISDREAERLAGELTSATDSAPPWPHPAMPDSPPWNKAAARVTRRVDAVRDATRPDAL